MTNPITVVIDENLNEADLDLTVELDPADSDSLLVSHNSQQLPDVPDQEDMLVDCIVGQTVRLIVNDFTDASGQTWSMTATPLTRDLGGGSWPRNGTAARDEDDVAWPHGDDYQSVTITATSQTAAGETQKRKRIIRVKMLTSNPQPGALA